MTRTLTLALLCGALFASPLAVWSKGGGGHSGGGHSSTAHAGGAHSVSAYTTRSGTRVQAHRATNPDNTTKNNWSHKGNVNPDTGKVGTKND